MKSEVKRKRKWPWALAAAVVVAGAAAVIIIGQMNSVASTVRYIDCAVARGDVVSTITGSGMLRLADSFSVQLPQDVEVSEVMVEAGDTVAVGDALAVLDEDSLALRAAALADELSVLDKKLATGGAVKTVSSPVNGRVKRIYAEEGGDVMEVIAEHGALALLSTDGLMQVETAASADAKLHDEVEVKWDGGAKKGEIVRLSNGSCLITLDDAKAPYDEEAEVYLKGALIGSGKLEIHAPVSVYGTGGAVDEIKVKENDAVRLGATLFTLDEAPDAGSYTKTLADREDKLSELQSVLAYIEEPTVTSPEAGLVIAVYMEDGKKPAGANDGIVEALTLGTGGAVKMGVAVDELDIGKIQLGQEVEVMLDAYAGEAMKAAVTRISRVGVSAGSITNYMVEVTLDYDARLLDGMNGSAVITADTAKDVLYIPITAIYEDADGEYVYVKSETGERTRVGITTGLSDGTSAEVTSGLQDGDTISYIDDSATGMMAQFQQMSSLRGSMGAPGAGGGTAMNPGTGANAGTGTNAGTAGDGE